VEDPAFKHSIVSAVKVKSYNLAELVPALQKCLGNIGGLNSIVKPGNKVFVKINHLSPPSPPEKGIVTHPVFAEAVVILLKKTAADITIGDDIEEGDGDGFKISGYREMCERQGVKLVNLREAGFVEKNCNGKILKNLYIAKVVTEAEVIINLPKFKTHSLTTYTGGIKNMYGIIPAGLRRRFHRDCLREGDFAQMLVDINTMAMPALTIIDGITAMEGEGPGSGTLKDLGLVLASRDVTALDAIAGFIMGLKPEDVLTTRYAGERGVGISNLKKIEVTGEKLESLVVPDFKLPAAGYRTAVNRAPQVISRYILEQVAPRPRVIKKHCTACAKCVEACPTGAAAISGKTAAINKKTCIRCMCCHEVCRFNAVYVGRPVFGTAVYGMVRVLRKVTGR
jgi:uncharacterized protein (DUF362 family)/NAD-dependent dihydropyrimidine dehydrogenase PreA subunit